MFRATIQGTLEEIQSEYGTRRLWNILSEDFMVNLPKEIPVVLTINEKIYNNENIGPYHTRELTCEMQCTNLELGFDYNVRGFVQEELKPQINVSRATRLWQLITGK